MTLASFAGTRAVRALAVGVVIFTASVAGIDSRLPESLAVLWPANAILLAVLIRHRAARRHLEVWSAAAVGYVAADLSQGTAATPAVVLAVANLAGVFVALLVLVRLDVADVRVATPSTVVRLASGCVAGCAVGAVIGATVAVSSFGGTWPEGWLSWFACDLVNYACLLPALLTVRRWRLTTWTGAVSALRTVATPWTLLIGLLVVAWLMRDSGSAVAFTMPALMACALGGRMFATALMVMTSTITMLALSVGVGASAAPAPVSTTTQIALALLALGPLLVAAATAERRRLLDEIRQATTRDDLTGVLRRGEFAARAQELLAHGDSTGMPTAFLMMDLDHFKLLNDRRGHRAGDQALVEFSAILRDVLGSAQRDDPRGAIIGRVGGEEFAALLPGVSVERARALAEEIRRRQEERARADFGADGSTVSIGVSGYAGRHTLDELMMSADASVYSAKRQGRNDVVVFADTVLRAVGD
ncbi:sensor domain-containing diguanylate cyclase [Mycolicibacterium chubuense]|uniref:Putative diguanylate cyclase YcdT n=1 Tax=Mycolicibacterium chubuense TaxID=1800 RepID=A0A0J6Z2J3_MYCCU|nr:GGDEF domain-containing protein [Mycolicibacterium chubuense]KMO78891.1 putative diguanylate cyclase YcdT [Mycolicibacterium chubuense]ORA50195.1 sensor domain-containing diguanylate cyclase [Mycolicibacterium chubuense]SPX96215.1 diguanylate cyclase [Mycolicibacterium chubuense]